MEIVEEVIMGSNDHLHVVKGKRTKRQRPSSPSPFALPMITTSSSGEGDVDVDDNGSSGDDDQRFRYPTTSADEFIDTTEEEEDLANCLILLAQGYNNHHGSKQIEEIGGLEKFSTRKFISGTSTNTTNKSGFYVYECKTCNRCFPSFQALGGHRASHKKPKVIVDEKKALMLFEDDSHQLKYNSLSSLNNKSKIHECSICGSEFSSGQALGGHMRRHRATTATTTTTTAIMHTITKESQETKKPRIVLSLDLNLPATDHDDRDSKFSFTSKQQSLVFSPSPLVDCHY